MKLPESGSWLSAALRGLGNPEAVTADYVGVDAVTDAQLNEALDAMVRGDIEFVILEDGGRFLQAAGSDAGPYQVERRLNDSDVLVGIAGGVDRETMRRVMQAYRVGDVAWTTSFRWTPVG